jgi:hypothetical protein
MASFKKLPCYLLILISIYRTSMVSWSDEIGFFYNLIMQKKNWYFMPNQFFLYCSAFNCSFFLNYKNELSQTAIKLPDSFNWYHQKMLNISCSQSMCDIVTFYNLLLFFLFSTIKSIFYFSMKSNINNNVANQFDRIYFIFSLLIVKKKKKKEKIKVKSFHEKTTKDMYTHKRILTFLIPIHCTEFSCLLPNLNILEINFFFLQYGRWIMII